jgi:hypothetical protein
LSGGVLSTSWAKKQEVIILKATRENRRVVLIALLAQAVVILPVLVLAFTRYAFIGFFLMLFSLVIFGAVAAWIYFRY